MSTFVWIAIGLLAAALAGERLLVLRTAQLEKRAERMQAFFKLTERAFQRDDMPDVALLTLRTVSQVIDYTSVCYMLLASIIWRSPTRANTLSDAISKASKDSSEAFDKAAVNWMWAVSYNSLLVGWLVRRAFRSLENDPRQIEQVVYRFDGGTIDAQPTKVAA